MPSHIEPASYALDNDADTAPATLDCLAQILDPRTQTLLASAVKRGGRCLVLGAGRGSIAAWLADRVGPAGRVLAADVKPQHIRPHPGVHIARVDVTQGLPAGPFDVVHARLLLAHLPGRVDILAEAAAQLAVGGCLLVEEWGEHTPDVAVLRHPPGSPLPALYASYQMALLDMFRAFGNDTTWCVRVADTMARLGLVNVTTTVHARSWPGGSAGTTLPSLVSMETQAELVKRGLSMRDLHTMRTLLNDPATLLVGNLTWSTVGYQPAGGAA